MSGRTIAIGDIHGCSLALRGLLDAIKPSPGDCLVFLGDYIDRGPDTRGVLDQVIDLQGRCTVVPLMGNHEEMFIAALTDRTALRAWLFCGGNEAVASYSRRLRMPTDPDAVASLLPEEHLSFLRSCRPYHETDTHLFLHAGYVPELPLDEQPVLALRWRVTDAKTTKPHCSGKVAIVGHTPQRSGEVLNLGFLMCIDTNCCRGGWLTGLEVNTGQVWQTNARGRLRDL